jgi:hypothetical protein
MRHAALLCALATLVAASPVRSHDRWDLGTLGDDDGPSSNPNELTHGSSQIHDLEATGSPADQDWFQVRVRARHSYEARVLGATVFWSSLGGPLCAVGFCADLDRVDAGGTVLQGASDLEEGSSNAVAVRWIASTAAVALLRVTGPNGTALGTSDEYSFEFFDTTYAGPRFNNSASQTTFLIVQNLKDTAVAGNIDFYNASGTLLHSQPLALNAKATSVINTAALPGLAGQSGSVLIAQTGGYGALAGKAVALEPATGFTFDTPLVSAPR